MTPIIDPMWLYWASILPNIQVLLALYGGFMTIIWLIFGGLLKELLNFGSKTFWFIFITGIIAVIGAVLIPSQETLIMMKALEFVTVDNLNIATDTMKEVADYIIAALAAI